jgi:hypothetical protein
VPVLLLRGKKEQFINSQHLGMRSSCTLVSLHSALVSSKDAMLQLSLLFEQLRMLWRSYLPQMGVGIEFAITLLSESFWILLSCKVPDLAVSLTGSC